MISEQNIHMGNNKERWTIAAKGPKAIKTDTIDIQNQSASVYLQYFVLFSREYSDAKRFEYAATKLVDFLSLFFVEYSAADNITPSTCKRHFNWI